MTNAATPERDLIEWASTMCACARVRRCTRTLIGVYDEAMAPSGLKITQLPLLATLACGERTISSLAAWLAVDRTTLTRNLRVLEGRRLVETLPAGEDGRIRVVAITPGGRERLAAALEPWKGVQERLEERFGATRLRALYDELEALSAAAAG